MLYDFLLCFIKFHPCDFLAMFHPIFPLPIGAKNWQDIINLKNEMNTKLDTKAQLMTMTLGNPVEIPEVNGGFHGEIIQT